MVWIYAGWIIAIGAIMKHEKPNRDGPFVNHPRNSVCWSLLSGLEKLAVSILVFSASINPAASRRFIQLFKKSFVSGFESLAVFVDAIRGWGYFLVSRIHNVCCEFLLAVSGAEYIRDGVFIFAQTPVNSILNFHFNAPIPCQTPAL